METSLKTGFAQIFSCCPKKLSCPKLGGAAAPLAPPARTPMLNVVQRDVLHRFFLNIWLSWNVRSRNNRQQLLSCNTNSTLRYNFLGN